MGRASDINKAIRFITLLRLIPVEPRKITAEKLAELLEAQGFETKLRTLQRDLKELSESQEFGASLVLDDRDRQYGWSRKRGFTIDMPAWDLGSAIAWDLLGTHLETLLPPIREDDIKRVVDDARHWLAKQKRPGKRLWKDKVARLPRGMQLLPSGIHPLIAEAVYEALFKDQCLNVQYRNKVYNVEPFALVDRGQVQYLIVRMFDYEELNQLAMHRIKKATVLEEKVRPFDFNLENYLANGNMGIAFGKPIKLRAKFYNHSGYGIEETPLAKDQKLTQLDQQTHELVAHVNDTQELRWWLLGFGANVEVISPKSLREEIKEEIEAAFDLYR